MLWQLQLSEIVRCYRKCLQIYIALRNAERSEIMQFPNLKRPFPGILITNSEFTSIEFISTTNNDVSKNFRNRPLHLIKFHRLSSHIQPVTTIIPFHPARKQNSPTLIPNPILNLTSAHLIVYSKKRASTCALHPPIAAHAHSPTHSALALTLETTAGGRAHRELTYLNVTWQLGLVRALYGKLKFLSHKVRSNYTSAGIVTDMSSERAPALAPPSG